MIKITNQNKDFTQRFLLFNEENWNYSKANFNQNISKFFSGKKNEVFINTKDNEVEYLIGLGKDTAKPFEIQEIAETFSYAHKDNLQSVTTDLEAEFLDEEQTTAFVTGLFLGTYHYPFSPDHALWQQGFELNIKNHQPQILEKIATRAQALCNGQFACMEWLNKPANQKTAPIFGEYLQQMAKEKGLKYTSFNRQRCEELGLGAFLSVNQGSRDEAAFTILEYNCGDERAKTVGLVGKSVLFDTGGISLKDPLNMHYMKSDMGGATAVVGTLIAAADLKIPVNIIAILPITDNAISENAATPSDVVTAYNGKTIEILNTDAEGRMTLADGLAYLTKNYQTDVVIDLATLTGSAVRMFGDTCGALFCNDADLQQKLIASGDHTNQRLWPMPLWEVWDNEFKSDVADFKNISMKPIGDCIVAAKFLENFIHDHPKWAHLDIAGVAFGNVNYAKEKAATGYGVQLLLAFLE